MFLFVASALTFFTAQPVPPPNSLARTVTSVAPLSAAEKAIQARRPRAADACRRTFVGQDYFPQPAIWQISDADTTMYLLGTIHSLPRGFEWRTPQFDRIVSESQMLITEGGKQTAGNLFDGTPERPGRMRPDKQAIPIAERVSGERRAKWLGMSAMMSHQMAAQLDQSASWDAAMTIATLAMRKNQFALFASGVDDQLTVAFTKAGKPVAAMDDTRTVFASLDSMPEALQRAMLVDALDEIGQSRSLEKLLVKHHDWAKGTDMMTRRREGSSSSAVSTALKDQLLAMRNKAWVEVVKQRLADPGVMLVAVGAGHLRGDGSLLDLLAKQGIKAKRISPTTPAKPRAKFLPTPTDWRECDRYMFGLGTPIAGFD